MNNTISQVVVYSLLFVIIAVSRYGLFNHSIKEDISALKDKAAYGIAQAKADPILTIELGVAAFLMFYVGQLLIVLQ